MKDGKKGKRKKRMKEGTQDCIHAGSFRAALHMELRFREYLLYGISKGLHSVAIQ